MAYEFKFPDVGEGITEGELVSWKVKEGDQVALDQTLAEMETDKAVVEMPSPRAGKIVKLHAAQGDIVNVGDVLVTIEEAAAAGAAAPAQSAAPQSAAAQPAERVAPAATDRPAVTPAPPAPAPPAPESVPYTGSVVGRLEEAPEEEEAPPQAAAPAVAPAQPAPRPAPATGGLLAMPSVRALAKELGVDLAGLRGTGPGGRILKQDVEDLAQAVAYGAAPPAAAAPAVAAAPPQGAEPAPAPEPAAPAGARPGEAPVASLMGGTPESDQYGPVERVLFRGVRRSMARRMAEAVSKQAQVTTMDEADVTIIKHIREKERTLAAERGVRLTYLAFVVKACTASLKRFPRLNAVLDESGEEFLLKRYYNIGIAIDTKAGLMVPNIKNADGKSIFRIAQEIVELVDLADERKIELEGFRGGTFSITNYGAIGSLYATPVINYPEVAILGMGRVRETPAVHDGQIVTRLMMPLALTFDHRLVDGAEAARFLNLVIGYLQDSRSVAPGRRLTTEGPLASLDCEGLWAATLGCEVVLLVATDMEAALLAPALRDSGEFLIAGKRVLVGELAPLTAVQGRPDGGRRVALAISGIDKVNAAHLLTCLLQSMKPSPRLVLQTGIAGALPAVAGYSAAEVGDVVIATHEAYSDTGSSSPLGWVSAKELGWRLVEQGGVESGGVFAFDGRLVAAALKIVASAAAREDDSAFAAIRKEQHPRVFAGPCITASQVTGTEEEAQVLADRWQALAESMEGAAATHVCALYDVPFLEVRGVSNLVGDRDRERWRVRRAVASASWAARAVVDRLDALPLPKQEGSLGAEAGKDE